MVVKDRGVSGCFPVLVGEADGIAVGIDFPFAFEHVGIGLGKIAGAGGANGLYIEGIGVRVYADALELAADDAGNHAGEGRVFVSQGYIGPYLCAGIPEPHGRNVTGEHVGIRISVFVFHGMHGGIQRIGEAVDEHLAQFGVREKRCGFFHFLFYSLGGEGALFQGRAALGVGAVSQEILGAVPDGGLIAHLEGEGDAGFYLFPGDEGPQARLPIDGYTFDIAVGVAGAGGFHGEDFSVSYLDGGFLEQGRSKPEAVRGRLCLVEAQGGKDVPGRHLAHVFITGEAVLGGAVLVG